MYLKSEETDKKTFNFTMARSYCSQALIEFAAVVLLGAANLPF